jgi:hypothetical protein
MKAPVLFLLLLLAPAIAQAQRCPDKLPEAVEAKRAAIVAAAKARDWNALGGLVDKTAFMAANPNRPNPIAYWQQLTREGNDVPTALAEIFDMRCGLTVEAGAHIFPLASAMNWKEMKSKERKKLKRFYGPQLAAQFPNGRESGPYIGWRGVIEKDGRWTAFLTGE